MEYGMKIGVKFAGDVKRIADSIHEWLDHGEFTVGEILEWYANGCANDRELGYELVREIAVRVEKKSWKRTDLWARWVGVSIFGKSHNVILLLTDSVFEPEDWSKTFVEGLLRVPSREWNQKVVVELGTGSGWISIVLCKFTLVKQIVALDLNPHAVLVAQINFSNNGLYESDDSAQFDNRRLTVMHSDLLKELLDAQRSESAELKGLKVDFVIGCIPQVLQIQSFEKKTEKEQLYDLGNYCGVQGVLEDQFGLGLNASALEQAFQMLSDTGKVILNLADRPGRHVVDKMFLRRGMKPKTLWQSRIAQAADTDVSSLENLERETGADFEFFLHKQSQLSITAKTAARILSRGSSSSRVYHGLRVVQAEPGLGTITLDLLRVLRDRIHSEDLNNIDLSEMDEEQALFVLHLADLLCPESLMYGQDRALSFPASDINGNYSFRSKVATYVTRFGGRNVRPEDVFIGPERTMAFHSVIVALSQESDVWLVNRAAKPKIQGACEQLNVEVIYGPDSVTEMAELVSILEPKIVVFALVQSSSVSRSDPEPDLSALIEAAEKLSIPVILDGTETFKITSGTSIGGGISSLAEHPLRSYPIYLIALEHSIVYPGLSLTLLIHPERRFHRNLAAAALISYTTQKYIPCVYYDQLFDEMTVFSIWEKPEDLEQHSVFKREQTLPKAKQTYYGRIEKSHVLSELTSSSKLDSTFSPAEFIVLNDLECTPKELIHPIVPQLLDRSTALSSAAEETQTEKQLAAMASRSRLNNAQTSAFLEGRDVLLGDSVMMLLGHTLQALIEKKKSTGQHTTTSNTHEKPLFHAAVPSGSSPVLNALLEVLCIERNEIPCSAESCFLLDSSDLRDWLSCHSCDILILEAPVNVFGAKYSQEKLESILTVLQEFPDLFVICDESFGFFWNQKLTEYPSFLSCSTAIDSASLLKRIICFDSFSFAFSAPGFQLGWAISKNTELLNTIRARRLCRLPIYLLRAVQRMTLSILNEIDDLNSSLQSFWKNQLQQLNKNRTLLLTSMDNESNIQILSDAPALSVIIQHKLLHQEQQQLDREHELYSRKVNASITAIFLTQNETKFSNGVKSFHRVYLQ